jgi:rod shape-determining protein MreD
MTDSLWQRLDTAARNLTPVALTILLLILSLVPWRLPFLPPLGLSLIVISVYYWTVHRPSLMPLAAVFLIGVAADLMGGAPLISPLVLIAIAGVSLSIRRWLIGASPIVVWGGFCVAIFDAALFAWLLMWYVSGTMPSLGPGLSGALLGAAAYPLLSSLFGRVQRSVLRDRD